MEIIKRDGSRERYDAEKIARVIRAAFDGLGTECAAEDLSAMVGRVEALLKTLSDANGNALKVEQIQDIVETRIMQAGAF